MRILMVGNSLTAANNLPSLLEEQLRAHSIDASVVAVTRGGARLSEFANPSTKTGQRVAELLTDSAEGAWGFLIMQDMSHLPATNPAAHASGVAKLTALAKTAGAVPMVYGTWAYREDCPKLPKLGMSHDTMHEAMIEGTSAAAAAADAVHADVAAAFEQTLQGGPEASRGASPDLYAPDGIHPSQKGSQLAARVLAKAIAEHRESRRR